MKKDLDSSKAGYKLDLMETANADPVLNASDVKLLLAYVSVMDWPSGNSWLAMTLACAKANLSERQYWASRACLTGKNEARRRYLIPVRGNRTVETFKLVNPWRAEAIEHVAAMTEYHKERERQRKASSRATKSTPRKSDLSLQNLQGHKPGCHCKFCSPVPAEIADKYPSVSTPKKRGSRKDKGQGAEIIDIANHLRRPA